MKNKDISEHALYILRKHGINTVSFDIIELARYEGIRVIKNSDVNMLRPSEYGKVLFDGEQWCIIYDDTRTLEERRYTVAHELGHYFLKHNEEYDRFMRYQELQRIKHSNYIEHQADIFAKNLLNPNFFKKQP